ncbi:MAG: cupin domain-containing protein [Promethearchaeota archaeon]
MNNQGQEDRYSIATDVKFGPMELINVPILIKESTKDWQNISLCEVNDCVIRLGVIHGEFHWHKHDHEDEFFYVIDGLLHIDIEDKVHDLHPGQGFMVPRGVVHRTRAQQRTSILMVEGKTVDPTGD